VRDFAEVGGLMSYGANICGCVAPVRLLRRPILKRAKPAELPVVQSSKFELVINAPTATMLGLTVPPTLLGAKGSIRRTAERGNRMIPLAWIFSRPTFPRFGARAILESLFGEFPMSVVEQPINLPSPDWLRGAIRIGLIPAVALVLAIAATQFDYSRKCQSPWSAGFSAAFGPTRCYFIVRAIGTDFELKIPIPKQPVQ
jgi:hypothetical protein